MMLMQQCGSLGELYVGYKVGSDFGMLLLLYLSGKVGADFGRPLIPFVAKSAEMGIIRCMCLCVFILRKVGRFVQFYHICRICS